MSIQALTEPEWQTNEAIAQRLNEVIAAVHLLCSEQREAIRRCEVARVSGRHEQVDVRMPTALWQQLQGDTWQERR